MRSDLLTTTAMRNAALGAPTVRVIDETQSDLRRLIERDFGLLPPHVGFDDALLDWIHFRARLVPERPRRVEMSPQVRALRQVYPAIGKIAHELTIGRDVSPWLSDRIRRRKPDARADMMFNHWQVSHFHLGQVFVKPNKVARSANGDLLFAFITADRAVLLDVQPHQSWTMRNLLRILLQVSPNDMERYEVKGVLGPQSGYGFTDEESAVLRAKGISSFVHIEGRSFAPGLGISSSGYATRLVMLFDHLRRMLAELPAAIQQGRLLPNIRRQLAYPIGVPVTLGMRLQGGQLIACDKNRKLDLAATACLE